MSDVFKTTSGKHHCVSANSLHEFTAYSKTLPDHRSSSMPGKRGGRDAYYGDVKDMQDTHARADAGMAREGIEAVALARVPSQNQHVPSQEWQTRYDVSGSYPDVGRYLSGEAESMVEYFQDWEEVVAPIATLVVNIAVNCNITAPAFIKHGRALVALSEAIDQAGLQSEIWADATIEGRDGYTGRFKVRLKSPGEVYDPGAFMFALTHPAFFRAMQLNAMHDWPKDWQRPCSVGGGYGHATQKFVHPEDYPDGAIFIPAMNTDSDAGKCVDSALRQLGLLV